MRVWLKPVSSTAWKHTDDLDITVRVRMLRRRDVMLPRGCLFSYIRPVFQPSCSREHLKYDAKRCIALIFAG